jgi:hypothetical protein
MFVPVLHVYCCVRAASPLLPRRRNHAFYLSRYVSTGTKRVMGSSRDVQGVCVCVSVLCVSVTALYSHTPHPTALHTDGSTLQLNLALSEEKMSNGDVAFVGLLTPAVRVCVLCAVCSLALCNRSSMAPPRPPQRRSCSRCASASCGCLFVCD